MKVSIITFHDTLNFGATLQSVALSKYLGSCGFETEVVNYLPNYIREKKSIYKELKQVSHAKRKIRAAIKGIAYLLHANELKHKNALFEKFIVSNLHITTPYYTFDELVNDPPHADYYICGSDQIWNPALTGNMLDEAFFLRFAEAPKAAYGVSVGELSIDSYADQLREYTQDFSGISVREKSVAPALAGAIKKDVDVVLDCTLLLDKDDYSKMEEECQLTDAPYVLLYNVQNSNLSASIAKKLADQYNLAIIDVSSNPLFKVKGAIKRLDIGPAEFLSLIKNASYVVTNSFHGTVFSIIYEKQFYSVAHRKRSGRVVDLLDSLQLSDRLVSDTEELNDREIDYKDVKELLKEYRQHSVAYLKKILS